MIWVSWPKKSLKVSSDITEDIIREVILPIGLVDIKVCAVDEVWSGLKLVIRKKNRIWNHSDTEGSMVENHEVKALLFDMGGVVININFDMAFQSWERISLLSSEEISERFSMDEPYEKHERGEIEGEEYFQHLRTLLKLDGTDKEIIEGWNSIFLDEIETTLDHISRVRKNIPCFAFTNSNATHQAAWTKGYPRVVSAFDRMFVSSAIGLRKPEAEAFNVIAEATQFSLSETLFFDDTLENVEGALAAGLQAVHVRTDEDVKIALVNFGLL